jgi:hypothetical protein
VPGPSRPSRNGRRSSPSKDSPDPTTVAAIYKELWRIELFFKALKQNLKIKTFVGTPTAGSSSLVERMIRAARR